MLPITEGLGSPPYVLPERPTRYVWLFAASLQGTGRAHEDIPQPPRRRLVGGCLRSPRPGTVGLRLAGEPCQPSSPSASSLLLPRGSLPRPQPDGSYNRATLRKRQYLFDIHYLWTRAAQTWRRAGSRGGLHSHRHKRPVFLTIVLRNTGGQEQ